MLILLALLKEFPHSRFRSELDQIDALLSRQNRDIRANGIRIRYAQKLFFSLHKLSAHARGGRFRYPATDYINYERASYETDQMPR